MFTWHCVQNVARLVQHAIDVKWQSVQKTGANPRHYVFAALLYFTSVHLSSKNKQNLVNTEYVLEV